jgi:hypothetical protein
MELGRDNCIRIVLKREKLVHWQKRNGIYQQRNTKGEQEKTYK